MNSHGEINPVKPYCWRVSLEPENRINNSIKKTPAMPMPHLTKTQGTEPARMPENRQGRTPVRIVMKKMISTVSPLE